jgi:hypothetical protein
MLAWFLAIALRGIGSIIQSEISATRLTLKRLYADWAQAWMSTSAWAASSGRSFHAAGIVVLDPLRRPLALDLSQSGSAQGLNLIALLGSDRQMIPCYVCKIRCYVKDFPC